MGELHLPRKTMDQLDRSFWESIETERVHFLGGPLPNRTSRGPDARPERSHANWLGLSP
ncbi:MAG: hypothetical protein ACKOPG_06615 [Novosphingobium sp.]